jgi:thiol:disulfide interchange protein DsbC
MIKSIGFWGLVAAVTVGTGLVPAKAEPIRAEGVAHALAMRLPKTKVNKVDCSVVSGLCEVRAGQNVFYVDATARYLFIGHVYDMQTRQDITSASLLEMNPDLMVGGAASAAARTDDEDGLAAKVQGSATRPSAPAVPARVSLAQLPPAGGIEWGGAGPRVTVFSDFHCGYCRLLHQTLKGMGVHVVERPISVLGTRDLSEAVLCSHDRPGAVERAYTDEAVARTSCDTSGLDSNEKFARDHGFTGTPVIVRADGAVVEGYRPKEFLEAWLKGGA